MTVNTGSVPFNLTCSPNGTGPDQEITLQAFALITVIYLWY